MNQRWIDPVQRRCD